MRITLTLAKDDRILCDSCGVLQEDDSGSERLTEVFVGDTQEQRFAVLCETCMDLEEAAIADGTEFTGVTNPENPPEPLAGGDPTLCVCEHGLEWHFHAGCRIETCRCEAYEPKGGTT